jgi:hypothetical protein
MTSSREVTGERKPVIRDNKIRRGRKRNLVIFVDFVCIFFLIF